MMKLLYILLFAYLSHAQAQTQLEILSEKNFSLVLEKSNVTVICQAKDLEGKTVRWSHNDKEIALVANGNNVVFLDPNDRGKYSLRGGESSGGNFTFTIHDVSVNDVGVVLCEVNDVTPQSHGIDVFKYPRQIILKPISNQPAVRADMSVVYVGFNSSLNLSCLVLDSRPAANIVWSWEDGEIISDSDLSIEQQIVEAGRLFNTSSFLSLPRAFYQNFSTFGIPEQQENVSNLFTYYPLNISTTNSPDFDEAESVKQDTVELSASITCQAVVEDKLFSRSLLVIIGEERSDSSSINTISHCSVILWFVLLVLAYCIN